MSKHLINLPVQQLPPSIEEDDAIDVLKYFSIFHDNKWLILGVTFALTLLGAAYALLTTPIYKANLLIKVEDSAERPRNMPGDLSSPDATHDIKTAVASEMEVLRSRAVVSRAVDSGRFFIETTPKYFPVIGSEIARRSKEISTPGIMGYGGYVWGAERLNVSMFNVPEELEGVEFDVVVTGEHTYELRNKERNIDVVGKVAELLRVQTANGTIELRIDRFAAKPGAQFSLKRYPRLEYVERLQESLVISERGKQSGIIDVALEGADPKSISNILNAIGHEFVRQNIEKKTEEAGKALAFLNNQLPELKQELERSESRYNQFRNNNATVDVAEEARITLQQSLHTQTRLVELRQKRDELLIRYQPEHPSVQALDLQMAGLKRELSVIEAKLKRLPDIEQSVVRLSREVKINTELYTALLTAAQQLRLATESKIGSVRLLDNAAVPLKPIKPKRVIVIILSAMVGLLLGSVTAVARKVIYGRIDTPNEIEQELGLPVATTIPYSVSQEKLSAQIQNDRKGVAVLPLDVPSDDTVESLRGFRSSMQFAMLDAKSNIVMIAGPTPGVGKSFVSANFAAVLASIGKKVLLIDGDLRSGYLHRYFGVDRAVGLADVIMGRVAVSQAIQRTAVENVDFLSTGEMPRKPAELLAHENFGRLLQAASSRYDFILIDTAPILGVSDALIIASHAGAIFNVVRGGQTTTTEIEESVKRLNQAGHRMTGIVFNDSKQRSARYGYGAQYGKYRKLTMDEKM
jgi:tyrosine-protein kinase Etk/Wzc